LTEEWKNLISDLNVAAPVSLPRSYLCEIEGSLTSVTLCGFCDASTKAYAAVVYLLLKTEDHAVVRFVAAKTRIAPLAYVLRAVNRFKSKKTPDSDSLTPQDW